MTWQGSPAAAQGAGVGVGLGLGVAQSSTWKELVRRPYVFLAHMPPAKLSRV
jgi:hypothetical protein